MSVLDELGILIEESGERGKPATQTDRQEQFHGRTQPAALLRATAKQANEKASDDIDQKGPQRKREHREEIQHPFGQAVTKHTAQTASQPDKQKIFQHK